MVSQTPGAEKNAAFASRFLVDPERFPKLDAGEGWGDEALGLGFLGGPYAFLGLSSQQLRQARGRFGHLCLEQIPLGAVELQVFRATRHDFHRITEVGWEYSLDLRYEPRRVDLAGMELMASLYWEEELRSALWTWSEGGETFLGALENAFRAVVAYRLAESHGVLLHSAAVLDRGRVHVFLGRSGAGKTTISRLSHASGRQVLSDDLNALLVRDGRAIVCQMPFAGDFGQQTAVRGEFPLAGLYGIAHGDVEALTDMSRAAGLGLLMSCATAVGSDPHRCEPVIDTLTGLAETIPVRRLTFSRSGDPWSVL